MLRSDFVNVGTILVFIVLLWHSEYFSHLTLILFINFIIGIVLIIFLTNVYNSSFSSPSLWKTPTEDIQGELFWKRIESHLLALLLKIVQRWLLLIFWCVFPLFLNNWNRGNELMKYVWNEIILNSNEIIFISRVFFFFFFFFFFSDNKKKEKPRGVMISVAIFSH